jgi:DNA repair protein RAD50
VYHLLPHFITFASFTVAKERDIATSDPRRNDIPIEIRQLEEKIDSIKRRLEDDKIELDSLRHSAEAQNAISVLQEQCSKDLESLEESMREQSFVLQKYNLHSTAKLPRSGDDNDGDQIVQVFESIQDSVRDKYGSMSLELSRATDDVARTQHQVSEKSAILASSRQTLASLRSKLDYLGGENGSVAKVRQVAEELRRHEAAIGFQTQVSENDPRELVSYLEQRLKKVEEDAPAGEAPEMARKLLKKLKKMVR